VHSFFKNECTMQNGKPNRTAPLTRRIGALISTICEGMYEREETISVAVLAALCGQNAFLYGPPGTAKSLIARRTACVFQEPAYFEYLMNRFSTPEEVFGPVSVKALKEDRYLRKTDSYLPTADFAFLDEIWKASPAILNTLLTLINERTFKNGDTVEKAPLKALIAASNETPDVHQGLDALFDRFIVRLVVPPISALPHFEQLLNSRPTAAEVHVPDGLRVRQDEWKDWLDQIHAVTLSPETITIIHLIRDKLAQEQETLKVYVSDRRWQRAATLMKAAAFFNGRSTTNHGDAFLLQHCIWTHKDNHQAVTAIIADAVRAAGLDSGLDLADIDGRKEALDREIHNELYHSADVYKTETNANGREYFRLTPPENRGQYTTWNRPVFLPYKKIKSNEEFHAVDESGNELDHIVCKFDGQGACTVTFRSQYNRQSTIFKPEILFHRGDRKPKVNERLVASLSTSIGQVKAELWASLEMVSGQFDAMESKLASLFVPIEKTNVALAGMSDQIDSLKLRIKDCERLESLCR
jgi:MoxR-like ATPase